MKKFLLLCLCGASAFAQETPAPAAVEGVRGVRQEGAGKVKEIDPAAKNVAPTTVQGVEKVDGVKTPGAAKPVKQAPPPASVTEGAKPVDGPGTKATPPPPPTKGLVGAEGVKPPEGVKGAGTKGTPPPPAPKGVEAVQGVKPPESVKGAGTKATPPPPPAKGLAGATESEPRQRFFSGRFGLGGASLRRASSLGFGFPLPPPSIRGAFTPVYFSRHA